MTEERAAKAVASAKKRQIPIGVLLLLPSLIWSTVFPFSKLVLKVIPPTLLAALRFSIGACFLTAYAIYVSGYQRFISAAQRNWPWFILLGSSGVFLNNLLQNLGLNLTTASSGSLLSSVDPIFSVILSAIFLGERMNGKKLIGLITAFIGIFLVTTNGTWVLDWGDSGLGNVLVIASALSYSVYTVASKRVLHHEDPPIVVAWSTIIGAVFLVIVALFAEAAPSWTQITTPILLSTLYLSIVPTSVSVVAYAYLLQRVQASLAAISLFLIPAFSIIWSVLLLREQLGWPTLAGGALIIAGVALAVLGGRQQNSPTQ
ncbi:MAG: DMT family transporter [Firmicutes bacterium]|nr:DMT family transporter [Bacillota bacterium]